MKRRKSIIGIISAISLLLAFKVWSEDEDEFEREERRERKSIAQPVVLNAKFKAECMSCHMGYLPGLLPARSWIKMMDSLDKHFGEDASLDEKTKKEILDFLVKNSSDHIYSRRGSKISSTIKSNEAPLRISETEYFKRKHHELALKVFKRKAIGSKANCIACHKGAEQGNFEEHEVVIPREDESLKKK